MRALTYRCPDCGHHPKRIVSQTAKKGAPRQHKKPCDCDCHRSTP